MNLNIGIVGSRRRASVIDYEIVKETFLKLQRQHINDDIVIISGGCRTGGDKFAETIAKLYNNDKKRIFHAEWRKYGRIAGFIRNTDVANNSDILIACVAQDRTGGTEDTIIKFLKKLQVSEQKAIEMGVLFLV